MYLSSLRRPASHCGSEAGVSAACEPRRKVCGVRITERFAHSYFGFLCKQNRRSKVSRAARCLLANGTRNTLMQISCTLTFKAFAESTSTYDARRFDEEPHRGTNKASSFLSATLDSRRSTSCCSMNRFIDRLISDDVLNAVCALSGLRYVLADDRFATEFCCSMPLLTVIALDKRCGRNESVSISRFLRSLCSVSPSSFHSLIFIIRSECCRSENASLLTRWQAQQDAWRSPWCGTWELSAACAFLPSFFLCNFQPYYLCISPVVYVYCFMFLLHVYLLAPSRWELRNLRLPVVDRTCESVLFCLSTSSFRLKLHYWLTKLLSCHRYSPTVFSHINP